MKDADTFGLEVIYEDNHIIAVNKKAGDIVQADKTGDAPLSDTIKAYIKQRYDKPGDVFLGTIHRIDRPTTGIILYARTSKGLSRMNELFSSKKIHKTYWAIVENKPAADSGTLIHTLKKNEVQNKSYVVPESDKLGKKAVLHYKLVASSDRYHLLEVELETGRHHQIRVQLSKIECSIKGDLKYGAARSNKDGSISLHARSIRFEHPIKKTELRLVAKVPNDPLWKYFEERCQ